MITIGEKEFIKGIAQVSYWNTLKEYAIANGGTKTIVDKEEYFENIINRYI